MRKRVLATAEIASSKTGRTLNGSPVTCSPMSAAIQVKAKATSEGLAPSSSSDWVQVGYLTHHVVEFQCGFLFLRHRQRPQTRSRIAGRHLIAKWGIDLLERLIGRCKLAGAQFRSPCAMS